MFSAELGREKKAEYLKKHLDEYDSFILGGSKAGSLYPETLYKYTNEKFYNFFTANGCFEDYERFVKFIVKNKKTETKEIILHLSLLETENYSNYDSSPSVMIDNVFLRVIHKIKVSSNFYLSFENFKLSLKRNKNTQKKNYISERDGVISTEIQKKYRENLQDSKSFYKHMLSYNEVYEKSLYDLFYKYSSLKACEKNIESLKGIQLLCKENNIEFKIIIGPTFVTELYRYHSEDLTGYFKEIAEIQPFWNFSGFNYINMDSANFYNGGHYLWTIGDKMIDKIYSKNIEPSSESIGKMEQFGQIITSQNIDLYINNQKEIWKMLKSQYDLTGKINIDNNFYQ